MGSRVVVIGSLSMDMVFQVPRRPARGETVKGFSCETFVGGKGNNQALAAAKAGAEVAMVGKVGDDEYGKLIREELEKNAVDTSCLFIDKESGSGLANIYVDPDGDNSIVIVPRANDRLNKEDIDRARDIIAEAELVMLQLEVPLETVIYAAELARKVNTKVMLNPAPAPDGGALPQALLGLLDYLIPNESEAALLTNLPVDNLESAKNALAKFKSMTDATVIITLGEKGVVTSDRNGEHIYHPAFPVDAVDTTAAGDAFLGCLAGKLVENVELQSAIKYACAAGALATTVPGAVPSLPYREKIEELAGTRN